MKILPKLFFVFILAATQNLSQGIMKIETDKNTYSYGETIEVRVTISNDSDSSFTIFGSSTCIVRIGFNSVPFQIACTADYSPFPFPPHSSRTWIWKLVPDILGIPDKSGEQVIYGYGGGLSDSTKITAPKYYGGRLAVGIKIETPTESIQSLRDSLNASVLYSDTLQGIGTISELWWITNYSVDSLVNVYSNDPRLKYIEVVRGLQFKNEIFTSVETNVKSSGSFVLYQNYPNPFNPTTTINYSVPKTSFVTIKIYDALGREVTSLVNKEKQKGNYSVDFSTKDGNTSNLPSGIYFYKLTANRFTETKKMLLLK